MRRTRKAGLGAKALAVIGALVTAMAGSPGVAHAEYLGFPDIAPGHWCVDFGVVDWAEENDVINGIDGRWAPDETVDRGQAAAILFNYSGDQRPDEPATFDDADELGWAAGAVAWAQDEGVFNGNRNPDGSVTMDPWDDLTREQAAAILYNMSGDPRGDVESLNGFPDGDEVSDWALGAVAWGVEREVLGNGGELNPTSPCTRAEFVTMLKNVIEAEQEGPGPQPDPDPGPGQGGGSDEQRTMTRAEWVSELLEGTGADYAPTDAETPFRDILGHRYEREIRSAYAYDVIPDVGEAFGPDQAATRDFVYAVAAMAAGIDATGLELDAEDASDSSYPELIAGALREGLASLDDEGNFNPLEPFDPSSAEGLIARVVALGTSEDEGGASGGGDDAEVVYRSDVKVIEGYEEEGDSYSFASEEDVAVGDKVALVPAGDDMDGASGTVTSVSSDGSETVVTIEQATMPGEIYRSIDIEAQNLPVDFSDIELADGIELDDSAGAQVSTLAQVDLPELKLKLKYPPKGDDSNFSMAASASLSPYLNIDFKYDGLFGGLRRLDLGIGGESKIEGEVEAKVKDSVTMDLIKRPVKAHVTPGVSVDVNLALEISAEGSVSFSTSVDNSFGYRYIKGKKGNGFYGDTDVEAAFKLDAKARGGIEPYAALNVGGIRLADLALSAGVEADGKLIVRDTGLLCNDVAMFAYADLSIGEHSDLLKWFDLTLKQKLWDEDSSPYRTSIHWENGERVPKCTYKEESEGPGQPDDPAATPADDFVYDYSLGYCQIVDYVGDDESIVIPAAYDGDAIKGVNLCKDGSGANGSFAGTVRSIAFERGSQVQYFTYDNVYDSPSPGQGIVGVDFANAGEMKGISIKDSGTLRGLDLSNLTKLESAAYTVLPDGDWPRAASFEGVTLKNNTALRQMAVINVLEMESPDLSEAPNLTVLSLRDDGLSEVDVSMLERLGYLEVVGNKLSELDASRNAGLYELACADNQLVSLKLPDNLYSLICNNNKLTELDMGVLRGIAQRGGTVYCGGNNLSNAAEIEALSQEYGLSWIV